MNRKQWLKPEFRPLFQTIILSGASGSSIPEYVKMCSNGMIVTIDDSTPLRSTLSNNTQTTGDVTQGLCS